MVYHVCTTQKGITANNIPDLFEPQFHHVVTTPYNNLQAQKFVGGDLAKSIFEKEVKECALKMGQGSFHEWVWKMRHYIIQFSSAKVCASITIHHQSMQYQQRSLTQNNQFHHQSMQYQARSFTQNNQSLKAMQKITSMTQAPLNVAEDQKHDQDNTHYDPYIDQNENNKNYYMKQGQPPNKKRPASKSDPGVRPDLSTYRKTKWGKSKAPRYSQKAPDDDDEKGS